MHIQKFSGKVGKGWNRPLGELKYKEGHERAGELYDGPKELKFEDVEFEMFGPEPRNGDIDNYLEADWQAAYDEMKAANKLPSIEDIVRVAFNQKKQARRQKASLDLVVALGLQQPNLDNDDLMVLETIYKGLRAAKIDHEEAKETAARLSKKVWPEGKPEQK